MVKTMMSIVNRSLASLVVLYLLSAASMSQAALMFPSCPGLTITPETEGNDDIGSAQNIDALFNTEICDQIELGFDAGDNPFFDDMGVIPHASIENDIGDRGRGRSLDFFEFNTAEDGVTGIFDIDFGEFDDPTNGFDDGFNSWVEVYDEGGNRLAFNDNAEFPNPIGDQTNTFNSFLEFTFGDAGKYFVAVGKTCSLGDTILGLCTEVGDSIAPIDLEKSYILHVSLIPAAPVPLPGTLALFAIGMAGAGLARRRGRKTLSE